MKSDANPSDEKPSVSVYTECRCSVCQSGARWFMCPHIHQRAIMRYECAPKYVDCKHTPHPDAVREIESAHPGCMLVYFNG